jgi:dTDP-4-amino-4,6-dideoxygalactose transaminase
MKSPYQVVKDFEAAVAEYTGAPYCVAVNSCTSALMLAVAWQLKFNPRKKAIGVFTDDRSPVMVDDKTVGIPRRTYCSVPQSIIHAGGRPTFRDEDWLGAYQLKPLPVWDSARWFTAGMYRGRCMRLIGQGMSTPPYYVEGFQANPEGTMLCTSFHASKILGDTQGGAILHDNPEADAWFRKARFDGRTEGVAPKDDHFDMIGHHCYLSADIAARLLLKLYSLPRHNEPLPNDDYPDLSTFEIFK